MEGADDGAQAMDRSDSKAIPRLGFLDALRAVAALWVVHYHLILIPQPALAYPEWAWLASIGGMGVTLFFVASSFSLCHTMPIHSGEDEGLSAFYLRRFFRIAPLFYFMLGFYFLRDIWLFNLVHGPGEVAINALFVFNLIPGEQSGYVWASSTVGVEMLFYVLFPFAYRYFDGFLKSLVLVVLCAAIARFSHLMMTYLPFDAAPYYAGSIFRHLPVFALGLVAFHAGKLLMGFRYRWATGLAFLVAGVAVMWALITGRLYMDSVWAQGVSFSLILIGLLLAPLRVIVNRITGFLGKISYSLYLVHPTLVYLLIPVYRTIYEQPIGLSYKFIGCSTLTLSLLIPLSFLTYRWLERPGIELGKRFLARTAQTHSAKANG
jgi:peptidoglycan/LPS O-acetylase OafA/YrhL